MSLWLVRAGRHGEHEPRFFADNRVYLTWGGALAHVDLTKATDSESVKRLVFSAYPDESKNKLQNWAGQISAFTLAMKPSDWVVVPRKTKGAIAFGEITGPCIYEPSAEPSYVHSRAVKWLNTDVPRSVFDQDLLYSFGAFMTVCEISRNDAEKRVRAIAQAGWTSESRGIVKPKVTDDGADNEDTVDLEQLARDQIAKLIERRFKGHEMSRLVEAILQAQGYTTFKSPPGPDKGIDILAAPGPLGFGKPRICVQVKSQDAPVDSPTLHQLIGSMQNVQADQGLLVAWGGWKSSVDKELPNQFFRVRLWDQDDLIEQLLEQFERLPEDLRAELPLKRIWTIAAQEEEE
jgi:restriction system protein